MILIVDAKEINDGEYQFSSILCIFESELIRNHLALHWYVNGAIKSNQYHPAL